MNRGLFPVADFCPHPPFLPPDFPSSCPSASASHIPLLIHKLWKLQDILLKRHLRRHPDIRQGETAKAHE